jgi:hypothetical protein
MTTFKLVPVKATEEMVDAGMLCTGVKTQWSAMCEAAPSAWRPIEEAPKDVSRLLLFCNPLTTDTLAFERPFVTTGYWDIIDEAWCATTSDFSGPFLEPTHFITLDALGMPGGEK